MEDMKPPSVRRKMSGIAPQGIYITTVTGTFAQHLIQTSSSDTVDHSALFVIPEVAIRVLLRKVPLATGFGASLMLMGADDVVDIIPPVLDGPSCSPGMLS
jgi:hypothetical protein